MAQHNPYELLISLSLDDLLNEDEQTELDQHMQTCESCTDLFDRMELVDAMFAAPPEITPQVNLTASIMGRIESYEARRRWQPWLIAVLVIASLVAAFNIAAPVLFFSLGINQVAADWPIVVQVISVLQSAAAFVQTASIALAEWLEFIINEPAALGVILAALVMASTWIGFMEASKAQQLTGTAQEA